MIFYKDVRIGLKHLLIVPAMFALMYLAMKLIAEGHYGHVATQQEIGAISLAMLATFNTFIAIVIGAQVTAEEKHAGTHLLLARLPSAVSCAPAKSISSHRSSNCTET